MVVMLVKKLLACIAIPFVFTIPVDDPSNWPGHLEPFGSKQNVVQIQDIEYAWPSAAEFYSKYVDKVKPVHVRGVYKHSKPVRSWNDEYLLQNVEASKQNKVLVEPNLKENRSSTGKRASFFEFMSTYHKQPSLIYSPMPQYLRKDLTLPEPLRCNVSSEDLVAANLVMSQGGSKSHVYNDDVESIFCALRGSVDYLLIEYTKNKGYVIDMPQGGYSTVDVDRVDYVKYPYLRKIDKYIKVQLEPGDCLYVPYRWYKQFNSYANNQGQSIAFNIWFKHTHRQNPPQCQPTSDAISTLDRYGYSDDREEKEIEEEEGVVGEGNEIEKEDGKEITQKQNENILYHFKRYVEVFTKKNITVTRFYHIIKRDPLINHEEYKSKFPKSFNILIEELLDADRDHILTLHDFQMIEKDKGSPRYLKMIQYLEYQTARIEDYIEDLDESQHHETIHEFDRRKMEEFKSARAFDEL
ncbi:jmjC domain-containing protein E-like [Clytia hemisphaerica]|uniref:Cupin-like domain-containing protein n=1 Tax=Clytia hemisphaerica TaxID=252671 RepID=A0A7M5VCQ5_9CNID|eukprot:TCONS_00063120-protein